MKTVDPLALSHFVRKIDARFQKDNAGLLTVGVKLNRPLSVYARKIEREQPGKVTSLAMIGEEDFYPIRARENYALTQAVLDFEVIRNGFEEYLVEMPLEQALEYLDGLKAYIETIDVDYESQEQALARQQAQELEDEAHRKALLEVNASNDLFGSW